VRRISERPLLFRLLSFKASQAKFYFARTRKAASRKHELTPTTQPCLSCFEMWTLNAEVQQQKTSQAFFCGWNLLLDGM
jgi:hypothetical protein